jgi:hypothetical protein
MQTFSLSAVIKRETELLRERRRKLFGEETAGNFEKDKFGIALSGGGIRSATINLGFLRTLNLFKILEKADYLSTVSGGGYTGAYIQATLKKEGMYDELFDEEHLEHLRRYGAYLIPGQNNWEKLWNTLLLIIGFLASWLMSLLSPAVALVGIYTIFKIITSLDIFELWSPETSGLWVVLKPAIYVLLGVLGLHFIGNLVFNFHLSVSKFFNKIESIIAIAILAFLVVWVIVVFDPNDALEGDEYFWSGLILVATLIAGFFLNPNSLSFHRFYRKQLADAFLAHSKEFKNMLLKNVFKIDEPRNNYVAPYPLINTCLNLQNPGGDDKFKGAKASDYFLLSPEWCGSKLSGYVKTAEFPGFKHMTLPAALTISAAAVNPGMGIYSSKLLSILMTLFNARLGFWVNNPSFKPPKWVPSFAAYWVWWPLFFYYELSSKIGTKNSKLNISDGGHIENLAVYELLRRRCRLILAVDAGADPESTFADLENLSIRARNELGIDICFRPGEDPVDIIRPRPSSGYAQKRFAVADLLKIWEEFDVKDENGEQVFYEKNIKEGGGEKKEKIKLEALVNYFYSKQNPAMLKFRVDLKADRGLDFTEERFDQLQEIAVDAVKAKLAEKQGMLGKQKIKVGTLVYIKSSVTSPRKLYVPEYDANGEKNTQFDTFKYKIYHPEFPHESTADQFFDPVQWESYYQLGQYIATDILDTPRSPGEYHRGQHDVTIEELIELFDKGKPVFKKDDLVTGLVDASSSIAELTDMQDVMDLMKTKSVVEEGAPSAEQEAIPVQETIAEEMQFKI